MTMPGKRRLSTVRYFLASSIAKSSEARWTIMSAKKGSTVGIDDVGRMRKMMEEFGMHEEYISAACKFAEYDAPVVMFPLPAINWAVRRNNASSMLICMATCLQECRGEVIVMCEGRRHAQTHLEHLKAICTRDGMPAVPSRLVDCQIMSAEELSNAELFEGVTFLPANTRKSVIFIDTRSKANRRLITIEPETNLKWNFLQSHVFFQAGMGKMLVFYRSNRSAEDAKEGVDKELRTEAEYDRVHAASIRHVRIERKEEMEEEKGEVKRLRYDE